MDKSIVSNLFGQEWSWQLMPLLLALPFLLTYFSTTLKSSTAIKNSGTAVQPPPVPYWIPLIGNLFPFAFNTEKFLLSVAARYGKTPVQLKLVTEKLYLVTGAENVLALFKNSRELSTQPAMIRTLVKAFGFPAADVPFLDADDSGILANPHPSSSVVEPHRRIWYQSHRILHLNLTGSALNRMTACFMETLSEQMANNKDIGYDEWTTLPDFYGFLKSELFQASMTALCGPHLFELSPTFAEDFWAFDHQLPNLFKGVPQWMNPKGYRVRERLLDSIAKWQKFANEHVNVLDDAQRDVEWEPYFGSKLMRCRQRSFLDTKSMNAAAMAAVDLGMVWGANANAIPAAGWMLLDILLRQPLLARVRAEIGPSFLPSSSKPRDLGIDVAKLCAGPLMQSVYTETLRLRVAVVIQRSPTVPDFKIDNWSFSEGKMIMANHWIAARDEAVWNTGRLGENGSQQYPVDEFWGERFLEYPDDPLSGPLRKPERAAEPGANGGEKSISDDRQAKFTMDGTTGHYFPYSGGLKMCPGRFFAKQEIIGATAMILSAYDIEFVDVEAAKKIKPDMNYFPFGAVPPKGNIAVRIRRRRAT